MPGAHSSDVIAHLGAYPREAAYMEKPLQKQKYSWCHVLPSPLSIIPEPPVGISTALHSLPNLLTTNPTPTDTSEEPPFSVTLASFPMQWAPLQEDQPKPFPTLCLLTQELFEALVLVVEVMSLILQADRSTHS